MTDAIRMDLPDHMHAHAMDLLMMQQEAAMARLKPSVLYRPDLRKDGSQWSALYGPNIQEGVCGFGDTPEEAMAAFDKAWVSERITNPAQPPRSTPQEPAAEGRVKIVKPAAIPHIGEPHEGCECAWCWEMRSQGGACGCVTPDREDCTIMGAVCQCGCHTPKEAPDA